MWSREVVTFCQKLLNLTYREEHGINLFAGYAAGVIQVA
jgi:hypothetical protein